MGWIILLSLGVGGIFFLQSPLTQNSPSAPTLPATPLASSLATSKPPLPTPTETIFLLPTLVVNLEPITAAGAMAPDFTLPKLHASDMVTLSQLRGKAVIVNFWASLCPPCKAEAPLLDNFYTANQANGLVVLGVVPGNEDTPAGALAFASENHLTYPLLWDDQDQVVAKYGVVGLPTSVLVRPDGTVDQTIVGALTENEINAFLQQALLSKP